MLHRRGGTGETGEDRRGRHGRAWGRGTLAAGLALAAAGVVAFAGMAGNAEAQTAPVVIPIELSEWSVAARMPSVAAGVPVRLVVSNRGGFTHALAVTELSAQTALLAPGESATLDLGFAAPGRVTLICPVGGGSHRQRGMEASLEITTPPPGQALQATPAPPPAPAAAALTRPGADVDRVGLPEDYRQRFATFYVFDRADNRQVRHVYVNPVGLQVREGQPHPYGTILVMETYRAQITPDNQIALDSGGRYIKGDLAGIFVMRKERGFGEKYGVDRTGEWEYVAYRPDGSGFSTPPERTQACAQCHLAVSDPQRDWVARANLFFAERARLPASVAGLPRTGGPAAGGLPVSTVSLTLAAGAPVLALAGLALRRRARRR